MEGTSSRTVTTATTATWGEIIFADGTLVVTLPPASWGLDAVTVKNIGSGAVTLLPAGANLIDRAARLVLDAGHAVVLVPDGRQWRAVASSPSAGCWGGCRPWSANRASGARFLDRPGL